MSRLKPPPKSPPLNRRIIRPELFHTVEVSGVLVPGVTVDGGLSGCWRMYLRWHADGRRECIDLPPSIVLADGTTELLFDPQPMPPAVTAEPGWSVGGREEWLDTGADLEPADFFRYLQDWILWFLDFPPDVDSGLVATLALWVMLTYTYPAWPAVPYLAIRGTKQSGKTRVFEVLCRLVFRPLFSSSMTAPLLFRTLGEEGGTLLFDEAERLRDDSQGELLAILLAGYKAGGQAHRLEKVGDKYHRVAYPVFGPKALACIGMLPDTLTDRCIPIAMSRAAPNSPKPRRRLDAYPDRWTSLRDDLHVMALEYGSTWLSLRDRTNVCPNGLSGRDFELWHPLLALASWLDEHGVSGLLSLMQKHATKSVQDSRDDSMPEPDETLLRLLAKFVVAGTQDALQPIHLLKKAREEDPALFERWTAKRVSNTLAKYGLRTSKSVGRRLYQKVTIDDLRRVARLHELDLGLPRQPRGER